MTRNGTVRSAHPHEMHEMHEMTARHTEIDRLINLLRDSDSATRTLSAWINHPVDLQMMSRTVEDLTDSEFADLDAWHPEPIQRRKVRLMGDGGRVLSEATATVVLGRVPSAAVTALRDTDTPLGAVLAPLQARRHTLQVVRRERAAGWRADVLFSVTARLDVGGRPVAMVRERYLVGVLS